MFWKYLHNKSSDLYEILNLCSCDSSELPQKFWWWLVHAHARTNRKCAHLRWNVLAYVFAIYAHVHEPILTKICMEVHYMSLSLKFHRYPLFNLSGYRAVFRSSLTIFLFNWSKLTEGEDESFNSFKRFYLHFYPPWKCTIEKCHFLVHPYSCIMSAFESQTPKKSPGLG